MSNIETLFAQAEKAESKGFKAGHYHEGAIRTAYLNGYLTLLYMLRDLGAEQAARHLFQSDKEIKIFTETMDKFKQIKI